MTTHKPEGWSAWDHARASQSERDFVTEIGTWLKLPHPVSHAERRQLIEEINERARKARRLGALEGSTAFRWEIDRHDTRCLSLFSQDRTASKFE